MAPPPTLELPPYLTTSEVADLLRVTDWTVLRWLREGKVTSIRPGRQHLIPRADVERLLDPAQ
jgi:excisionase family DNA binding protein